MSKLILVTGGVFLAMSSYALAASNEDCTAMWKKADAKAEGKVAGDMAKPYLTAMEAAKMPAAGAKDGVVTDKEFMDACVKDAFKDMK